MLSHTTPNKVIFHAQNGGGGGGVEGGDHDDDDCDDDDWLLEVNRKVFISPTEALENRKNPK